MGVAIHLYCYLLGIEIHHLYVNIMTFSGKWRECTPVYYSLASNINMPDETNNCIVLTLNIIEVSALGKAGTWITN